MTASEGPESRPASSNAVTLLPVEVTPRAGTLPPPAWLVPEGPMSAATLALERYEWEAPTARRSGSRAELFYLERALARAKAAGDVHAEREAAAQLARACVARGVEFARAIELAERALELGAEAKLRAELAQWFAGLGQPARAATTLTPTLIQQVGVRAGRTRTRIALLQARAGDALGMSETLQAALAAEADDPVPAELLGAISAWAPAVVSLRKAAEFYLEGNRRRHSRGDRLGAFEDLVRAFEAAPESRVVAESLVQTLIARGRTGAADEVLREHAQALGDAGAGVHEQRLIDAARDRDWARALGAVFDAGLEAVPLDTHALLTSVDPPRGAIGVDAILEASGLPELVAARLELALGRLDVGRSAVGVRLGQLYFNTLGQVDRAIEAWVDAVVADPSNAAARTALREAVERTQDPRPLIDALSYVAQASRTELPVALDCLEELAHVAHAYEHAGLRWWALQRHAALRGPAGALNVPPDVREQGREHTSAVVRTLAQLASLGPDHAERDTLLRAAERALWGGATDPEQVLAILAELNERAPEEPVWGSALERRLRLLGRRDALEAQYRKTLARTSVPPPTDASPGSSVAAAQTARARLALGYLWATAGDSRRAFDEVRTLVLDRSAPLDAWCLLACLSVELHEPTERARSCVMLARSGSPALRAVLLSKAAELFFVAGDLATARHTCEQARLAEPTMTRPSALQAKLALVNDETAEPRDLERAMGVAVPRSALCGALSAAYQRQGETELALAWAQRQLVLKPGDPQATQRLLECVLRSQDGGRVSGALSWLLSQPQPIEEALPQVVQTLRHLLGLDVTAAATLARRALDVVGPCSESFCAVVLNIADVASQPGLALTLLERRLATDTTLTGAATLLLDLARRRREAGDTDGAARALLRAAQADADHAELAAASDSALPTRSSDGELALLEVRARLCLASDMALSERARLWRDVGAARWDLSEDPAFALEAWEKAAELEPERGSQQLARDLVAFAGHAEALRYLQERAGRQPDERARARDLAAAARVALHADMRHEALNIAVRALRLDPQRADALAIAERTAAPEDAETLEEVYALLSRSALGCYGERAAEYRAARHFEKQGQAERALEHAIRAFEAVPSEGIAFVALTRLAAASGRVDGCVAALGRVASSSRDASSSAIWLNHAAKLAGGKSGASPERTELLLRALAVHPSVDALVQLGGAMRELGAQHPEEKEALLLRFERALKALLKRLEGLTGARIALKAVEVALLDLGSSKLGLQALLGALRGTSDLDEYAGIAKLLYDKLNPKEHAALAAEIVTQVAELAQQDFVSVCREVLEIGAFFAQALERFDARARFLVRAAEGQPADVELVRRARDAAYQLGDDALIRAALEVMPPRERLQYLNDLAVDAEASGRFEAAIDALARARLIEGFDPEQEQKLRQRLVQLYRRTERFAELERWMLKEINRPRQSEAQVTWATRELANLAHDRGDHKKSLELLKPLLEKSPADVTLLKQFERAARDAAEPSAVRYALELAYAASSERGERLRLGAELARQAEELQDFDGAAKWWGAVLALDEQNLTALTGLERDAERRGEYELLAEVLERRTHQLQDRSERRRLSLKRAKLLEERLGNAEGARELLELLVEQGDLDLGVVAELAGLYQRTGAPGRAAPLFEQAASMAASSVRLSLLRNAAEAHLSAGDVERARQVLFAVPAAERDLAVLELVVSIEKRGQDPAALSRALQGLALAEVGSTRRAALLVEAAQASLTANDAATALTQARRALNAAPEHAEARLLATWLDYLQNGRAAEPNPLEVAQILEGLLLTLDANSAGLCAFLLVEYLDVVQPGSGLAKLQALRLTPEAEPLVALALAERLAESGAVERVLALFESAERGELRRVRSKSQIAVAAAKVALAAEQHERALRLLEGIPVEREPAAEVNELRQKILQARVDRIPTSVATANSPAPKTSTTAVKAQPIISVGSVPPFSRTGAQESAQPWHIPSLKPPQRPERKASTASGQEGAEEGPRRHLSRPRVSGLGAAQSSPIEAAIFQHEVTTAPKAAGSASDESASENTANPDTVRGLAVAPSVQQSPDARPSAFAIADLTTGTTQAELEEQLALGSLQAGRALMALLEKQPDKRHELLNVCQKVVAGMPGEIWALRRLARAALDDGHVAYARAVEHVIGAFEPDAPAVEAPPVGEVSEHPEFVEAVLFRDLNYPATDALALLWETSADVVRRDLQIVDPPATERVVLGGSDRLAWRYSTAARALGQQKTPLCVSREIEEVPSLRVLLSSPPSILLSGSVEPASLEFAFHLGAMLAATRPQFALLFGAAEPQVRAILGALRVAFGPPLRTTGTVTTTAHLAEALWQTVPPRAQRRLKELCHEPSDLHYPTALATARRAARRAGLFIAGDLRVAVQEVCAEDGLSTATLERPGGLAQLCEASPVVADLVRIATSQEYAAIRWQVSRHHSGQFSRQGESP